MGIPNRVRGWIIRCQTRNNRGEVRLLSKIVLVHIVPNMKMASFWEAGLYFYIIHDGALI